VKKRLWVLTLPLDCFRKGAFDASATRESDHDAEDPGGFVLSRVSDCRHGAVMRAMLGFRRREYSIKLVTLMEG
jgi:hypothetical protein